ncbi:MAG: hypothetical protein KA178_09035 [Alphaproteobacteria bacterium]|nr:hypothetical protein [Alphaproteobacteria bacterium]MBP7759384.1 hypothetical protein [Alphaproteobacteria bacterium]MBP7762661.1 hypothetical protein [Alphaproteobacteria bacterium]
MRGDAREGSAEGFASLRFGDDRRSMETRHLNREDAKGAAVSFAIALRIDRGPRPSPG